MQIQNRERLQFLNKISINYRTQLVIKCTSKICKIKWHSILERTEGWIMSDFTRANWFGLSMLFALFHFLCLTIVLTLEYQIELLYMSVEKCKPAPFSSFYLSWISQRASTPRLWLHLLNRHRWKKQKQTFQILIRFILQYIQALAVLFAVP